MTNLEFMKLQRESGLSNKKLSEVLGVDVSTIDRWRMGIRKVQPAAILAIKYYIKHGEIK